MATLKSTSVTTSEEPKVNSSANVQSIGMVLASVAFGAVGQLTLKAGMNSLVQSSASGKLQLSLDTLIHMATNPLLIVGIAIFGVSTLLWLFALAKADLSFAYPFLSLSALGPVIAAYAYSQTGSYDIGLMVLAGCVLASAVVIVRNLRTEAVAGKGLAPARAG